MTVGGNEIVVDGRGNICINGAGFDFYINGAGFDFAGGEAPKPGYVKLITPDGLLRHLRVIRRPGSPRSISTQREANRRAFADGLGPERPGSPSTSNSTGDRLTGPGKPVTGS